jgi:hypothetical protein
MAKIMDEQQAKLYEIMEQFDGDTFNILHQYDHTHVGDVGRALWHQLKGHGAALCFIESRLRDIHKTSESLQAQIVNAVKAVGFLLWVVIAEGPIMRPHCVAV